MKSRSYSSEGIVLSRKNYGEADRILTVYSKHFGKIRLLARGVRKPKSKKRGHLEVFSRIKFSVSKGSGMGMITEAELIDSFGLLRKDLKKVSVAYFLCEVIDKVLHEDEKNELVFSKVVETLSKLTNQNNLKRIRYEFVYDILVYLGFWPLGKKMNNPDLILEDIMERKMSTIRVGKKVLN